MDTIKLRKPLLVNGKELAELPYDIDAVTCEGFARAESEAKRKKGAAGSAAVVEIDYTFQLYLGFEAVTAAEPSIDLADLERVSGPDLMQVMAVGRFFITGSEEPQESSSEAPSESTATSTTSARTK